MAIMYEEGIWELNLIHYFYKFFREKFWASFLGYGKLACIKNDPGTAHHYIKWNKLNTQKMSATWSHTCGT